MSVVVQRRRGTLRYAPLRQPQAEVAFESPTIAGRLASLILNPFKNYLIPASWLRWLVKHSRSPLIAESLQRPGGWRAMEIIYRNDEPLDWFDRQALRSNPICMAARNRRRIVIGLLTRLIAKHAQIGPVTIVGVGAGPGHHVQSAVRLSGIPASRIEAWLIDRDRDAQQAGQALASNLGLTGTVNFLQGDALRISETLPSVRAHIVKLVGLIEYLTDEQALELLQALQGSMHPGASLVTHGFVDPYGGGRFLARVFGLRHHRRGEKQLRALLESAGLRVTESVMEPANIHPIVVAEKF